MTGKDSDTCMSHLSKAYTDFADLEAGPRSPLYAEICHGVANDRALLAKLVELPLAKQQPNLLLAAAKYFFGTTSDWREFRERVETHWDPILVAIMARRTQTNE